MKHEMKKINENTKVTLTLSQLKALVKESMGVDSAEALQKAHSLMNDGIVKISKSYDILFDLGERELADTVDTSLTAIGQVSSRIMDRINGKPVRTDVPMFEDDGDDEEPVLWWEVVSKETGARFASGTVPENEKAEKFKSVLEFLYGDDVEVKIERVS